MTTPYTEGDANTVQGGALHRLEGPCFCTTAPPAPPPYRGGRWWWCNGPRRSSDARPSKPARGKPSPFPYAVDIYPPRDRPVHGSRSEGLGPQLGPSVVEVLSSCCASAFSCSVGSGFPISTVRARVTPMIRTGVTQVSRPLVRRRSPPRPSLKALGFFNSVRGHPRFNPRCGRERAIYTRGFASVPAPALVCSAHTYWPIPPHGNAISHSNLQMQHRVTPITDVLTIIE
jgi:hypothetical protein